MAASIDRRDPCTCESPICPRLHASRATVPRPLVGLPPAHGHAAPAAWLVGHRLSAVSRRRVMRAAPRSA